jgi:hypothetical protein
MNEESKSTVACEAQAAVDTPQATSKRSQVKEGLQTLQTVLAIVGGVGTLFVWGVANFYVGDVEIVPNHPYENLNITVFDRKGQETAYHVPKFQLMPGMYHVEISANGTNKYPADIEVQFGQTRRLLVSLVETPNAQRTANGGPTAQPARVAETQSLPSAAEQNPAPQAEAARSPLSPANDSAQAANERSLPAEHHLSQNQQPEQAAQTRSTAASNEIDNSEPSEEAQAAHHHWWQFLHKKIN